MKKIILTAAIFLVVVVSVNAVGTYNRKNACRTQKEIADNIIRFHIRANSDSDEDQNLKLKIKDRIVEFLSPQLKKTQNLDEARQILYDNRENVKEIALEIIKQEGYKYTVNVYFENCYFPVKTYADMTFPAGEYEAYRVDIGNHEGKNWWCVLFPPLCMVDSTYAVVPDDTRNLLMKELSDEAYDTLTINSLKNEDYEVRFKYLTFLNDLLP